MANIFLIDDHPAVRHGLGLVLSSQLHAICGEAGSIVETLDAIGSTSADIALLDLSLGEESGLELIAPLRAHGMATLVYSMHEDARTVRRALDMGANGYVCKREMAGVLLAAISGVLQGDAYVSPMAAQGLAKEGVAEQASEENALSGRENKILSMLGNGETNAAIAATFAISIRTVETYFERISAKLAIAGTRELRRHAIRRRAPGE
jgi:DNA-binding NarL/FixJ family response regulator